MGKVVELNAYAEKYKKELKELIAAKRETLQAYGT